MKRKSIPGHVRCAMAAGAVALLSIQAAVAHDDAVADGALHDNRHLLHDPGVADGHIPPNVNYGFELVGVDNLGGIATGQYTDVWAHNGFAYVGTFQEPTCDRSGVYVSDIRDPANPVTVDMLPSPPNTRINDVKVHSIGGSDYLFVTLEQCGPINPQGKQKGQGGIAVYNVSNPMNAHSVKRNYLDTPIHNTFIWTTSAGTYLMAVDDVAVDDVIIVDMSKPQSPQEIVRTGIQTWLDQGTSVADDGQLFTGVFAAPLLHDIWVEETSPGSGVWHAVLSYWDAGFIILDVTDPANPVFVKDSTYPDPDPVHGISPAEGNAHAAVFGGNSSEFVFGGDEDFDAIQVGITAGGAFFTATQGSNVPQIGPNSAVTSLAGPTYYVGEACSAGVPPAPSADAIAIIGRGTCSFTEKVTTVTAEGYAGAIVMNDAPRCDESVSMLVDGTIPALFVPRPSGLAIMGKVLDPATCDDASLAIGDQGQDVLISGVFDGWGYFHVLNNTNQDVTVPFGNTGDTRTLGYLGEIGYYAPQEVRDPDLAVGFGDLTMHNLEADPENRNRSFISWYSAGMRAVEWRPGHLHNNLMGEGVVSWNVHEVGRWIADDGSNFWGVHVTEINGEQYILGSDRNTGLHIFKWSCIDRSDPASPFYCNP